MVLPIRRRQQRHCRYFAQFISHCCTAFLILRKSAAVFVNLFSLIADQDIFDSTGSLPAPVSKAIPKARAPAVIGRKLCSAAAGKAPVV